MSRVSRNVIQVDLETLHDLPDKPLLQQLAPLTALALKARPLRRRATLRSVRTGARRLGEGGEGGDALLRLVQVLSVEAALLAQLLLACLQLAQLPTRLKLQHARLLQLADFRRRFVNDLAKAKDCKEENLSARIGLIGFYI